MKKVIRIHFLTLLALLAGGLSLALHLWVNTTEDSRGLLNSSHISVWLLLGLLVLSLAGLVLLCRKLPGSCRFPASPTAAVCAFVAAVGLVIADIREFKASEDILITVNFGLGLLAALSLCWLGLCRLKGNAGTLLPQVLLNVYFAVHLIVQYRQWSGEPQILLYCFPLLASVCLMLQCYHRAMASVMGTDLKRYSFLKNAALILCCCACPENWIFYGSMVLWTASDWCVPYVKKENPHEAAQ